MKLYSTIFLLFFYTTHFFAQSISGVVRDSVTKQSIEAVSFTMIDGKQSVLSDGFGNYHYTITDTSDKILVSCVGYQSVIIDLSGFLDKKQYLVNLSLIPHIEELKEIVVTNTSKGNYTLKKIGLRKNTAFSFLLQSGYEICTLIKTPYVQEQYVKSVILNIEKRLGRNPYLLNCYRINLYEYNVNVGKPGPKINVGDIIIFPENKNHALIIDVDSLMIPFPVKGLCVGIETIRLFDMPNDEESHDVSSSVRMKNYKSRDRIPAPLFSFAKSDDIEIQTWERNINEQANWEIARVKLVKDSSDKNLKINIQIKIKNDEK